MRKKYSSNNRSANNGNNKTFSEAVSPVPSHKSNYHAHYEVGNAGKENEGACVHDL